MMNRGAIASIGWQIGAGAIALMLLYPPWVEVKTQMRDGSGAKFATNVGYYWVWQQVPVKTRIDYGRLAVQCAAAGSLAMICTIPLIIRKFDQIGDMPTKGRASPESRGDTPIGDRGR